MKKIRFLILSIFFFAVVFSLTGCRCYPAEHKWNVTYFEKNTTYANGVEQLEICYGIPYVDQPFGGMENGVVDIQFFEDGGLTFKPGTGETLTGTYALKHKGLSYTNITVVLDNGETFCGKGSSYYYGESLELVFRGMQYRFDREYRDAEEIYQEHMAQMPNTIRRHCEDEYLKRSTVVCNDGVYSLMYGDGDILLLDGNVAVKCVNLDKENVMTAQDSIKVGECFSVVETVKNARDKVLIYYVEPLPNEPIEPTEPDTLMLYECEDQLRGLRAEDVTEIKFTKEFTNLPSGNTKYHRYITDTEQIKSILEKLNNVELIKISDPFDPTEMVARLILNVYTETDSFVIVSEEGLYRTDTDENYILSDFPHFLYDGAVQTFVVTSADDKVRVSYDGKDLGEYILSWFENIEFIIDPEDYDYEPPYPHWTYTFDFGDITVYDQTHFRYKGQFYLVVGDITFDLIYP